MQIIEPTHITIIWSVVKIFFIVGLSVYLIFALVIMRQIQIMSETVKLQFELPIKILGLAHFLFALSLLVFSILAL